MHTVCRQLHLRIGKQLYSYNNQAIDNTLTSVIICPATNLPDPYFQCKHALHSAGNCYVSIYSSGHWSNNTKPSFKSLCKILGQTFFMLKFQLSCDSFSLWVCWLSISRFHEWVYCLLSIRSVNSCSKGHLFINACFTQRIFVECIMTCASPGAHSLRLKLKLDRLRKMDHFPLFTCVTVLMQTEIGRPQLAVTHMSVWEADYFWLVDHQVYS